MTPSLFPTSNVIIQGITGSQGTFHTKAMLAAGTNIVGGTSPNKAGSAIHGVPVYASVADIKNNSPIDASVIFVPARFARAAIMEAIDENISLVVCITENIPVHDMLYIKQYLKGTSSTLIGPNCPGVLVPGAGRLGIVPDHMSTPGSVAIVSRSGTLTYEAMASLSARGVGQKYVIGIGGDPIKGMGFVECLSLFENDPDVSDIVMIGEIGGTEEIEAAAYIQASVTKPVFSYIAGHHAPPGVQLGHAGAILGSNAESASAKTEILARSGAITANSITELIAKLCDNRT